MMATRIIDKLRHFFYGSRAELKVLPGEALTAVVVENAPLEEALIEVVEPTTTSASPNAPAAPVPKREAEDAPTSQDVVPATIEEPNLFGQAMALGEHDTAATVLEDVQPLSPAEEALASFLNAGNIEERSTVLLKHPYFQNSAGFAHIQPPLMTVIIKHMTEVVDDLKWRLLNRDISHTSTGADLKKQTLTKFPDASTVFQWAQPENFLKWQQHAFDLANNYPGDAQKLHECVEQHLVLIRFSQQSASWLSCAELYIEHCGALEHRGLLDELFHCFPNDSGVMQPTLHRYPNIHAQWLDENNDGTAVSWCGGDIRQMYWLTLNHPRIHAWDIIEQRYTETPMDERKEMVEAFAKDLPEGALLKAWYGIELTVDEIAKHPLAHSLYVHKHAPMYLEEVQPLPSSWEVALGLSETGKQFRDALVQTAKAKLNKEPQLSFEIPDLGSSLS